jgi:iron(III) transport system substrate-binding protein
MIPIRVRHLLLLTAMPLFLSQPLRAELPAPMPVTPELVQKATAEGKLIFYSAADLPLTEAVAKAFEQKYPGIKVQVERTGSERVFQRIGQEYTAKIYQVDVVNSSDASHFVVWKRDGWLAPYVTPEMVEQYDKADLDKDGLYASWRATLSPFVYNTNLVKPEDVPKSFKDLLDPKWANRLVKSHPGYSGVALTSTFQTAQAIGWEYFEALAKQKPMQVQSATDPARKVAAGEREVAVDGSEYLAFILADKGNPVKVVYPAEGTPMVTSPSAVMKNAPHPNAARLFQAFLMSIEVQQMLVDTAGMRSLHKGVAERKDHVPMREIKLLPEDPVATEKASEQIKRRYRQYFGT